MLAADRPQDYVIATGLTSTLEAFVAQAFAHFGLDWRDHVTTSAEFARPSDIKASYADPRHARDRLGWQAQTRMPEVVTRMCEAEVAQGAQP